MSFEIINGSVTITLTTKKNKEIEISIIEELDTEAPFCHIGDAEEIPPYFEDVKTITDFSELVNNLYGDGYGDDVLKGARTKLSSDDEIREFTIEENVETEYEEKICSFITFDLSDFSVSISRTWNDDYNSQKEWVVYCLKPFDSSLDKKVIAKYNMIGKNAPTEKRKMGDKVYFLYCESSGLAVIYGSGKMWDILDGWESEGVLDGYEISELIIDSGVKNICYHLVYDSYEIIRKVTISDTVKDFAEEALEQCCIEKIVGGKGSAAEKYANDNKIDFEEMKVEDSTGKKTSSKLTSQKAESKSTKTKTAKSVPQEFNDPDYIIEGTVLKKYIGKDKKLNLPSGLTEIPDGTFSPMSIESIVVPEGVKTIGRRVFEGCTNLTKVVLPSTVKELGGYCFCDCHKLQQIILPSKIKTISDSLFSECYELENVVIPKGVKCIDAFAFKNCRKFSSIVIPSGVERIGFTAFTNCKNLEYLYIPASVTLIQDNYVDETPFGGCDKLTIHCPAGSYAEEYCKSHGFDYKIAAKPKKVSIPIVPVDNFDDNDFDPVAAEQIVDSLDEIKKIANELGEDLAEAKGVLSKYSDYLEKKTAKEKVAEEEKIRKKAEAMAKGKSEKDIVNMFVTLTNEKKLGHLHRNQNEFFEIYEDDFAALSKAEVIKLRKDMLVDMDDESLCAYYTEKFKQRTVKDRFYVSTMNLKNVSEGSNFDEIAEWSIEMTKEWYAPTEYAEVRELMDLEVKDTRKQISDNFKVVDEGWIHFPTAKDSLQLVITSEANNTSNQPDFSNFQIEVGSQFVTVRLANKSLVRISTVIANYMPWYWSVSIRDIWEAAFKNDVHDEREGAKDGNQVANQAITQIRSMYPDAKATVNSYSNRSETTDSVVEKSTVDNSANQGVPQIQQSEPAKKSGCYVATAVYGSYDCPEVWTLRRFRDYSLATTFFGRLFIMLYYAISPTLVKMFGDTKWFKRMWKSTLDKMVEKLKQKGYESTPYEDKNLF